MLRAFLLGSLRNGVLLAPVLMLAVVSVRTEGEASHWYLTGAGLQFAIVLLMMVLRRSWAPDLGLGVLVCYLVAAGWMWVGQGKLDRPDWYVHFSQALLLIAPLVLLAGFTVTSSGALLFRRARMLAQRIQERTDWPRDLVACKDLAEVKAFREALVYEAGPALVLLTDPRPQVRLAALTAMEFRKHWRDGQAETVMALLPREPVPEVRVAAVNALANTHDREIVESLAECLRDHDARVRKAAADALFWDVENRWSWIRYGVRRALADQANRDDGPLLSDGQQLPQPVVDDLLAWATEKGVLSYRACQTLGLMYGRAMQYHPEQTQAKITEIVERPNSPPLLRIELARLLKNQQTLEPKLAEELLDGGNPAPLRLIAAESLLEAGPNNVRAVVVLRDLARLPNRELSLATADVVQRSLGVDLGLALGQPMPSLNSSRAIEVTRRLMTWSNKPEQVESVLEEGRFEM
jgi:hypothetical protein